MNMDKGIYQLSHMWTDIGPITTLEVDKILKVSPHHLVDKVVTMAVIGS